MAFLRQKMLWKFPVVYDKSNFEFRRKEIRKKRIDESCIESIEIEDGRLCLP